MTQREIPTQFAPAARASRVEVHRQAELFRSPEILKQFSNSVADMVLILNKDRQIVHANAYAMDSFNVEKEEAWLGLRPGEAMQCAHANETEGGCGTTQFCRTCGSVRAVLASQKGKIDEQECRITQEKHLGSLDLRVTASPLAVNGESFTVYSARDITDEKRREALERIFFHDVLNTAGGLKGYLEVVEMAEGDVREEFFASAQQLTRNLIDEIIAQQELIAAERGDLEPEKSIIHGKALLNDLITLYTNHSVAEAREIVLSEECVDAVLTTDRRLLHRVIGNMIKNALEATEPGSAVTVGCTADNGSVIFIVHNDKMIPEDAQLQMFQRSFSTKGKGRGLGTYSIKLLGERYLGGKVSFTSDKKRGTIFSIELPSTPS